MNIRNRGLEFYGTPHSSFVHKPPPARLEIVPVVVDMVPRTGRETPHRGGAEAQRKTPSGLDPQRLCASAVSAPQSARQAQENGMMASIMNIHANTLETLSAFCVFCLPFCAAFAQSPPPSEPRQAVVLHAARLLEIESGKIVTPGEVLVQGDRIAEVGSAVKRPAGAEVIDLGDRTLMPGPD